MANIILSKIRILLFEPGEILGDLQVAKLKLVGEVQVLLFVGSTCLMENFKYKFSWRMQCLVKIQVSLFVLDPKFAEVLISLLSQVQF